MAVRGGGKEGKRKGAVKPAPVSLREQAYWRLQEKVSSGAKLTAADYEFLKV